MKLRYCATKPMGMAGTRAFACTSSRIMTIKPWAVRTGGATLAQAHTNANDVTVWSMGPTGGSTG